MNSLFWGFEDLSLAFISNSFDLLFALLVDLTEKNFGDFWWGPTNMIHPVCLHLDGELKIIHMCTKVWSSPRT